MELDLHPRWSCFQHENRPESTPRKNPLPRGGFLFFVTTDAIFLSNCFGWNPKVSLDSYHGVHTLPAVSVRNRWRQQRRGWSPVSATGSLHSARDISLQASVGVTLNKECCRSGKRGPDTTCKLGACTERAASTASNLAAGGDVRNSYPAGDCLRVAQISVWWIQ